MTATPLPWRPGRLTWAGDGTRGIGIETGPGFRAFAGDWPEGTRLEVTVRVLPPLDDEEKPDD